jgi:hypothetical protein
MVEKKSDLSGRFGSHLVDADFDETTPTTFPKNKIISELAFLTEIRNLKTLFSVQLIMLN